MERLYGEWIDIQSMASADERHGIGIAERQRPFR